MNINTLTIKAQEALQAALSLARERGQQAVEPLHLLAVLIREDDSLSTFLLGRVGVNVRSLRDEVGRAVASLPRVEGGGEQFFAQDTSKAIQRAVDFTKNFGDKYASVEHLLLALVAERGQAADILKRSGATEKELIEAIRTFRKGATVDSQTSEQQFDALASLQFNCSAVLSGCRVTRLLTGGDYTEVSMANAWCSWVSVGGSYSSKMLERRIRELQVYFYGDYTGNESDPGFRYLVHMPNGGSLEDNRVLCYPRGETYAALQTATRSGMYFAGWYTAASGGAHITNSTPAAENLIVYAHWSSTPVENPNEDNGGSGEDPVTLKTSEACIQFIKDHEGFSKFAYWDYGQWTIGYGTRCEENEFPDGITEEEADQRLRLMLVDFEKMVDDVLDASPLVHTQSQYDAMISFTFNLGPQWINPKYNIYQYFVYGGYTEMEFVNTMGRWLSSSSEVVDGLAKRRIDEADMYLNGVYRLGSTAYVRVVFNAMGGEAEEDYVYYKTGRSLGMLPNAYRSGHYFVGWYDRALSGGTCYTPETTAPARGNITLYARWEATGLPYQDISRDAWYFEAVSEATDRGLFQGTSETTFEPESTMNRAMLATVIYRMAGSPAGAAKAPFTDVAAADWFADAVAWAYENGVVKGMSATSFAPLQEITREQLAVMLLRYAGLCGYDTSARASLKDFADAAKVSDYAADAMQWAVANGILNGTDGKRLDPAGSATRAQCAAMLVRFLDKFEAPAA